MLSKRKLKIFLCYMLDVVSGFLQVTDAIFLFNSRNPEKKKARIIIATASVIKFEEALQSAAIPFTRDPRVSKLFESKQRYKDMNKEDNWLEMLQEKIEDIDRNRTKE